MSSFLKFSVAEERSSQQVHEDLTSQQYFEDLKTFSFNNKNSHTEPSVEKIKKIVMDHFGNLTDPRMLESNRKDCGKNLFHYLANVKFEDLLKDFFTTIFKTSQNIQFDMFPPLESRMGKYKSNGVSHADLSPLTYALVKRKLRYASLVAMNILENHPFEKTVELLKELEKVRSQSQIAHDVYHQFTYIFFNMLMLNFFKYPPESQEILVSLLDTWSKESQFKDQSYPLFLDIKPHALPLMHQIIIIGKKYPLMANNMLKTIFKNNQGLFFELAKEKEPTFGGNALFTAAFHMTNDGLYDSLALLLKNDELKNSKSKHQGNLFHKLLRNPAIANVRKSFDLFVISYSKEELLHKLKDWDQDSRSPISDAIHFKGPLTSPNKNLPPLKNLINPIRWLIDICPEIALEKLDFENNTLLMLVTKNEILRELIPEVFPLSHLEATDKKGVTALQYLEKMEIDISQLKTKPRKSESTFFVPKKDYEQLFVEKEKLFIENTELKKQNSKLWQEIQELKSRLVTFQQVSLEQDEEYFEQEGEGEVEEEQPEDSDGETKENNPTDQIENAFHPHVTHDFLAIPKRKSEADLPPAKVNKSDDNNSEYAEIVIEENSEKESDIDTNTDSQKFIEKIEEAVANSHQQNNDNPGITPLIDINSQYRNEIVQEKHAENAEIILAETELLPTHSIFQGRFPKKTIYPKEIEKKEKRNLKQPNLIKEKPQKPEKDIPAIGRWGENYVFERLKDYYRTKCRGELIQPLEKESPGYSPDKYALKNIEEVMEGNTFFLIGYSEIKKSDFIVEIKWYNLKEESFKPIDIRVRKMSISKAELIELNKLGKDEKKIKIKNLAKSGKLKTLYIEVKTTEDETGHYFILSTREKQKFTLHPQEHRIFRVTKARSKEAEIEVMKTLDEFLSNRTFAEIKFFH